MRTVSQVVRILILALIQPTQLPNYVVPGNSRVVWTNNYQQILLDPSIVSIALIIVATTKIFFRKPFLIMKEIVVVINNFKDNNQKDSRKLTQDVWDVNLDLSMVFPIITPIPSEVTSHVRPPRQPINRRK